MDPKAKRTEKCLTELEAQFKKTGSLADVLIILGRSGAGKSSLSEDLSDLSGYAQGGADSATQTISLCKATIRSNPYYIMDTPGFDPYAEEPTFREIARGIERIRPFARISGILYLTPITQQRFDAFDRRLVQFIRALCGDEFIPRVAFVTTFWTGAPASYNEHLEGLKKKWVEGVGAEYRELNTYQHGRVYNAAWQDTRTNIDWFSDRARIARYAKDMVERSYGDGGSTLAPRILKELGDGVPVYETAAGRLLGMSSSSSASPSASGSSSTSSNAQSGSEPERQQHSSTTDGASTSTNSHRDSTETRAEPTATSWLQTLQDVIGWFTRNVEFNVNVGGVGGGPGPGAGFGPPRRTAFGDPLSSVDTMKSFGLDSSMAGRKAYAAKHGITGTPGSAKWGDNIRNDVLRRYGPSDVG
ncbi:hypothetical protein BJY00DRAFT_195540 [Aspergillus carlsbadensis]|nr:hypothetical protein BJY00DRAFT_195540 [Aspergillus carlsbadensis]